MIECEAYVTANQPWSQDGTANVVLKESCNMTGERTLPLKHFPPGREITIKRAEYPEGLVVIPTDTSIERPTTTLPCRISNEDSIILLAQDWPTGYLGWFID